MRDSDVIARFMRRCARDPIFFSRVVLGVEPHPGQAKFLTDGMEYINVLTPGNRFGKSTVIAIRHLWHAFTKRGVRAASRDEWERAEYNTISISHSADQAEIVYRMAERMCRNPVLRPWVARTYETPFPTIKFANGAEMTCRSAHDNGKYVDGHAYRYVSIDEAGYIADLKHLVNSVILFRLAGGGMLDLIGTPKGVGSGLYWYANRARRGVDGYYFQRGSVFDNPHLSPEDLRRRDELLKHSDPRIREQVIFGEFVSTEGLAFTQDELDNAFPGGLPAHVDYRPGRTYVQAWDLGRKSDWTVGVTIDVTRPPFQLVDFQRLRQVGWEAIYDLIRDKAAEYHVALPRIDATGPQGDVIEEELWKRDIHVEPYRMNTAAKKLNLINNLQTVLGYGRGVVGQRDWLDEAGMLHQIPDLAVPGGDWGLLRMPSIPQLLDEFGVYQVDDKDLVQDSVISVAMAADLFVYGSVPEPVMGGLYG